MTYLEKYNARYNNDTYRILKYAIAFALDLSIDERTGGWVGPVTTAHMANTIINYMIDAAQEVCGSPHFSGRIVICGFVAKQLSDEVHRAYLEWLELFNDEPFDDWSA